ncbi:MmgE/PrpD family protein [Agromyces sp. SYSU T00194]|uniref:MmgE/PrpD family protein n=1 Tax=Agromyces chitinivorans TaxID=3158560 RepID=UPI003391D26E
MTPPSPERALADFAATPAALPPAVRARAEDLLIDALACAVAGRHAPGRDGFDAAVRSLTGAGDGLVVGDRRAAPAGAAMLDAWQATALTMCDVYRPRLCHVTPPVLGAVLAAAGDATPMREVVSAFAIGAEVTVRLCDALPAEAFDGRRWHAPGVVGPYGAAAAAGALLGLDPEAMTQAFGGAGLHSGGSFATLGSPGVKLTQARASAAGLTAAELARAGHGGGAHALTAPAGGLYAAFGSGTAAADPRDRLGEHWSLDRLALRRWPASSSLQSLIEAATGASDASAHPRLEVELPEQGHALCAEMGWDDSLSAMQSARWIAAVSWLDRSFWVEQTSSARRDDERVAALARTVEVRLDPDLPQGGVRLRSAGKVVAEIDVPLGAPQRPLRREDVRGKLDRAAGPDAAAGIVAAVTGDGDVGALAALLAG